jgi:PST family polysaccharide transporter
LIKRTLRKHIINLREKAGRHKTLIQNFSYLSALQVFNMLLPLITYPYLIRILGKETYGLIIFSQAIIGYLVIMVSFGFNITATKEVSIYRDNKEKLSEIISSVLIIKGIFFVLAFFILSILLYFIPQAHGYEMLFYLTMYMCLYELIFPIFYFQGIEKMKYMTYLNLVSRLIFLALIFILVKSKSDYLLVPLISGIGATIAGVISIILILRDGIVFNKQSIRILTYYFKNSYVMALAYASNTFKSNFNIIIVKFLFSFSEVAYFDLALKISNIGNTFLELISQTVFPKMSREKDPEFLKNIIILSLGASFLFIFFTQIFAAPIIGLLGGIEMMPATNILRIMVFFIPVYIMGALLGRNCLIVHGFDKQVLLSMLYSSIVYISIIGFLYLIDINIPLSGLILVYIISFAFETTYRYIICKSKNLF